MATEAKEITREQYYHYERVRQSGMTGMADVRMVMELTGLDKETVYAIRKQYKDLMDKWGRPELW